MQQLWVLIVDGFRESADRKIFWVLIGISTLVALAMLSIGFEQDSVTLLFGSFRLEQERFNPFSGLGQARIVGLVVHVILNLVFGWIGMMLVIIATAGSFPAFIQPGAVDVLLAKPISRSRLFLYKYLSGLVFVFVQASYFVLLSFLVMWLRWGVWAPGYLLAAPLLVLLFSYLYCVSVLVALRTRSSVAAALVTIGAWFAFSTMTQTLPQTFDQYPSLKKYTRTYQAVRVASWIPPKTGDIIVLAARCAGAGPSIDLFVDEESPELPGSSPEELKRARDIEERELRKNPWLSIGSSLLFEAFVLLLAARYFARRDF